MIQKYYKCTLKSDVVFNTSLATEGNMESLDYIPGSSFWGLVAHQIYANHKEKASEILHSGYVCFGDGLIFHDSKPFFAIPNCFLQDKLKSDFVNDPVYLDFNVNHKEGLKDEQGQRRQLKQMRSGYISADGHFISDIPKSFALKSAYNREERRTKEGQIFGLESIAAGTQFLFSIFYHNEDNIELVENCLLGTRRMGKSKFSQYGEVKIEAYDAYDFEMVKVNFEGFNIVYAASNLCFLDPQTGQQTFMPTADQLGIPGGKIIWEKSQIRIYSYSPWNSTRNASNMQRHCIKMGSIYCVEGGEVTNSTTVPKGEFINEGLGRILYNPVFLAYKPESKEESALTFRKIEKEFLIQSDNYSSKSEINTPLLAFLNLKKKKTENEFAIAKLVNDQLQSCRNNGLITKVTSSQWGNIRAEATEYYFKNKTWEDFIRRLGLADDNSAKTGLLTSGKMAEKLWDDNNRKKLNEVFSAIANLDNKDKLKFVIKFSSEMAKEVINNKNKTKSNDKAHA